MKAVIPPEVVAELHRDLKLGEDVRNRVSPNDPTYSERATMIFANVAARALVTLLAALTEPGAP